MEVILRKLEESDAYTSVKWRNDPEVFKYTGNRYQNTITLENELEWIRKVINNSNECRCAILADQNYIGNIYLTNIDRIERKATFHIFIVEKDYWGKGIGRIATKRMLQIAFNELGLESVNLRVRNQNLRAVKIYENVGFKEIFKDDSFSYMEIKAKEYLG